MRYDYLVFDLDGTISNNRDGIVRSINYALVKNGWDERDETELESFIGPPLDQSFSILVNSRDRVVVESLVNAYRDRYSDVGFSENVLYGGVRKTLEALSNLPGLTLGVCTSKRRDFAEQIIKMFGLYDMFAFISGGVSGCDKSRQLGALIDAGTINSRSVMIGDRSFDLVAARDNRIDSAGVLWGFGSRSELMQHDPTHLFSEPKDLLELVNR